MSKKVYGWDAPVTMKYDFVKLKGVPGKMSSSKGKVISLVDALTVYQPEVLRYIFAVNKVDHEFSISFDLDVITMYEAYDRTERIAWGVDKAKNENLERMEKRVYELSQIGDMPSVMPYQVPFRQLTTLLQTYSGDVDKVIATFTDIKPEQVECLRRRCVCAWYWVTECAPEEFKFALRLESGPIDGLSEVEVFMLRAIRSDVLPKLESLDEKGVQQAIYDVATAAGQESKALFKAVYRALIGKEQGPRLGSFFKIIGRDKLEQILASY